MDHRRSKWSRQEVATFVPFNHRISSSPVSRLRQWSAASRSSASFHLSAKGRKGNHRSATGSTCTPRPRRSRLNHPIFYSRIAQLTFASQNRLTRGRLRRRFPWVLPLPAAQQLDAGLTLCGLIIGTISATLLRTHCLRCVCSRSNDDQTPVKIHISIAPHRASDRPVPFAIFHIPPLRICRRAARLFARRPPPRLRQGCFAVRAGWQASRKMVIANTGSRANCI